MDFCSIIYLSKDSLEVLKTKEVAEQLLEDIKAIVVSGLEYGTLPAVGFFAIGIGLGDAIPSTLEWLGILGVPVTLAFFVLSMGCFFLTVQSIVAVASAVYDLDYHPVAKVVGYLIFLLATTIALNLTARFLTSPL